MVYYALDDKNLEDTLKEVQSPISPLVTNIVLSAASTRPLLQVGHRFFFVVINDNSLLHLLLWNIILEIISIGFLKQVCGADAAVKYIT